MRLVRPHEPTKEVVDTQSSPPGYARRRAYKKLDQLMCRVLQLDEILHEDCAFESEKAANLKRQIRNAQQKLERLLEEIGPEEAKRAASIGAVRNG